MKKLLVFLNFYIFLFPNLYAQLKQGQFAIGGTNNDYGYSMVQTSDMGFAIAGYTISYGAGGADFYVVKLDSIGNLKWTKTVGGNGNDEGYSIIETYDKGLAVAGFTSSYGAGNSDVYVVKLDSAGNLKWTKTIGGTGYDNGYSIIQTSDMGLAITGYTNSYGAGGNDIYVIKLDSAGNLKWTKTIGGTGLDVGNSIVQTYDLGFAIAGYTYSFGAGNGDVYVVKLDSIGNLKWTKTIGGINGDVGSSIIQTFDKGLAIAGYTNSFGNGDVYIIKLDSAGNLKWTKTIGGASDDYGYSIIQTFDKGLAVTGYTASYGGVYVIKLDSVGNLKWTKAIGGVHNDIGNSIIQTFDKGLAIAGYTLSYGAGKNDVYVIKLDSAGNLCHSLVSDSGRVSIGGNVSSGGMTSSGGLVGSGGTIGAGGVITNLCNVITSADNLQQSIREIEAYPNPSNGMFELEIRGYELGMKYNIEVYNVLGKNVFSSNYPQSTYHYSLDLINQPNGIYFYRIIKEDGSVLGEGKIIIQK